MHLNKGSSYIGSCLLSCFQIKWIFISLTNNRAHTYPISPNRFDDSFSPLQILEVGLPNFVTQKDIYLSIDVLIVLLRFKLKSNVKLLNCHQLIKQFSKLNETFL